MGSCQNYGHFWGTLNIRCRIILRTQKGTIMLTTTHVGPDLQKTPPDQEPQARLDKAAELGEEKVLALELRPL